MDLRQLEYFVAVAKLGHFTRAADHLHVGQPALSQAIRRLEREFGSELLDRTSHPIGLTSAGRALLPHAERVVEAVSAAREEFGLVGGEPHGRVALGVMAMLGPAEQLITEFHRVHPDVVLVMREEVTSVLIQELVTGQLDAVLATRIDPLPRQIEYQVAFSEPLVLMTPPGWTDKPQVNIRELDGEVILLPSEGGGVRRIVESALRRHSVRWRPGPETNELARQRYLTADGVGLTIVPQRVAAIPGGPEVDFIAIEDPPSRDVALMWDAQRRHSSSVREFLRHARAALDEGLLVEDLPKVGPGVRADGRRVFRDGMT